ncbi:MAG: hypothetical protein P8M62_09070 [Opitutae bacterium]|nr:hypothetical protein [Opitutales bacterium]MDG1667501.1 hypothetical protein [Opitutae bacterium]MDG2346180.1 hypothetical protein [Opitutae bacterium]
MKLLRKPLLRILTTALLVIAFTGCSSTKTENGVTVEKSGNPLKFW